MLGQQEVLNLEVFRQNKSTYFFLLLGFQILGQELRNIFELLDQQENLDKHLNFFFVVKE
jgi:hypothetical protein